MNPADQVVDRDPAHVLSAAAQRAADARAEGRQHPPERAPGGAQHDAEPGEHGADAGRARRLGTRLPLASHLGEKGRRGVERGAAVGERGVAAVAVDPDGGCRHQGLRRALEPGERLGEKAGADRAALTDAPPAVLGPAHADRLARQVDHRVEALELGAVDPALEVVPLRPGPRGPCGARAG